MSGDHPRDLSRLEHIRRAELSTGKTFIVKPANTLLGAVQMPGRKVNCRCGHVWIGHVILDAPGNLCPRCGQGATESTAGPVIHIDVTLPINVAAGGEAPKE